MANELLEQLARLEVPAPPAEFDRQLHQRVNRLLLVQQLLDLALRALPWTMLHFARALVGWARFSVTGRFDDERRAHRREFL